MTTSQIIVGELAPLGNEILASDGSSVKVTGVDDRAAWSWVRLTLNSRKKGDEYVNSVSKIPHQKGKDALDVLLQSAPSQRELQYILDGGVVKAVASTKHLLIPPEEIMSIAKRVDDSLHAEANFGGLVKQIEELPGFSIKYQLDPGNIFTREAIRMGYAIRVMGCFNPLSFLGGGGFNRFTGAGSNPTGKFERILRVEHKVDLEERIKEAIEGSGEQVGSLKETIENSKKVHLTPDQATTLSVAFPCAWSFGKGVIDQVVGRYKKEDQTLWGLAQAASYVARHGDYSKNAKSADIKLGVVGAAYLNINDVDKVVDRCKEWLNEAKINLADWV